MSGKNPGAGAQQPLLHSTVSPPPYGGSNYHHHHHGHHTHPYVPHVHPFPVVMQPQPTVVVVTDRSRNRFCKTLTIAIVVWLLFGALVRSIVMLAHWGHGFPHRRPYQWTIGSGSESPDYPVPRDIDLVSCEEPLKDGGSSQTTFQVPASSDTVLLFASGPSVYGTVRVTTTSAKSDTVKFSVDLESKFYRHADTIVCSVNRKDGEYGVGIFNPVRDRRRDDAIRYNVVVEFPENHPIVNRFESTVVNSVYQIEDLQGKISFEELSLHGSNGGIHSKSLFARWADIHTSNGHIDGYFNASDSLTLHTSNAHLDIDVDLNQEKADKAKLSMTTSNGALKARLHLYDLTTSKSRSSSSFDVTGRTSNSALNIAFLDAPVGSKLVHVASTSNSPAEVTLHPTYEGHFSLHSSLFGAAVHETPGVEDPSGKGRERHVKFRAIRGPRVEGDVAWGNDMDKGKGTVDVGSSNARVTVNL